MAEEDHMGKAPGWLLESLDAEIQTSAATLGILRARPVSDLTLGEVTEEVSEEFNGQSDISMSLPSSLNTPESPDDWHKYLDNSPRESGGLPFDMMVDVPAMKPTLPFKSSDKCRSIVTRAKSLSNFPPPPPLHKNNHRKSGKGPRTLYPPPPPPRPPGRLPDSGLRRKSSSSR
ncbi:hypothetical protein THAOC_10764 [Thalassiosira oceanica]|uniref:Uncharacterized protein n=1 Tax=Thalassiosira oceanica TaxID=159749 RepID=K0SRR9_THAOC|nr:hypothetical protein THAOC_10764 [Thalassiosira oceanica]|eukprot:EJK68095.1 hypothetical protein THAOC_10764 [Thalassiosira oceanica]